MLKCCPWCLHCYCPDCNDAPWLTKYRLGLMRAVTVPSLSCSGAEGTSCHPPVLPALVLQLLPHCFMFRDSGLWSGVADQANQTYRAEVGVSATPELQPVGEALTGVQAVVAVGILHLRHRVREKSSSDLHPGDSRHGSLGVHAYAHTRVRGQLKDGHTHVQAIKGFTPEPKLFSSWECRPSAWSRRPTPPLSQSQTPYPPTHTSLSHLPTLGRAGVEPSALQPLGPEREGGGTSETRETSLIFRGPYVHAPAPPSPHRRARPRGLP